MIKTILFDRWYVCGDYDLSRFRKFLTINGYDPEKERAYFKKFKWDFDRRKLSETQFWTGLKKALWFTWSINTLIENNTKNLVVDWGLLEMIQALKKKYTIVLWSNMDISSIRQIKKEVELDKFFDAVYFSRDLKMGKIETSVIQHIMKKCNCSSSEMVFVDDEERNFTQLIKDGYQTIVYTGKANLKKEFKKLWIHS